MVLMSRLICPTETPNIAGPICFMTLPALEAMILQVSKFAEAHPEVAELDLNPVFAYPNGTIAVDARVVLAPVEA